MRILKFPFWIVKQPVLWALFLFTWTLFRFFRGRSFKTRFYAMRTLARILYIFARTARAKTRRNISLIRPDLDEKSVKEGSWLVVETLARSWAATLGNGYANSRGDGETLEVEGIEPLLVAHEARKKVIAVVAHVGPLDGMFGLIPRYNLRVYVPAEAIKPEWFFRFMSRSRTGFGDIILEPVERGRTLERARHHLADGRIVVLTIDITRGGASGVLCRVGNGQARFPVGAIKLALEEQATIFPILSSLENNGTIRLVIGPPFVLERTGDPRRDIEVNTRKLIEKIYAAHIQAHYANWLRLIWINFVPSAP